MDHGATDNSPTERNSRFPRSSHEQTPRKRPAGNGGRLSRLLKLMDVLQSGRVYNSQELAELCGVSRRTVFRDIAALQEAGLSVLQDESRRGYFLPNRMRVSPSKMTSADSPGSGLKRFPGDASYVLRDPQDPNEVVIHFASEVARSVAERNWHHSQKSEFLPDGRLEFRVTVDVLEEISCWILGFGDRAVVLQPLELRDRLREHAENMVRNYQDGFRASRRHEGAEQ